MGCDCGCGGNPNCWCQTQQAPAREEHFRVIMETAKKEGLLPRPQDEKVTPIDQGEKGDKENTPPK
ncbi:MAG: hypothetical protein NTX82_06395 [Candidatus Parcubacteria bacterium]|nr:hypothetical protein [Candidatus Parcubacteria bacterium]